MCLTTNLVEIDIQVLAKQVIKTAKKDIHCCKKFIYRKGKLYTPYQNYLWPSTIKTVTVPKFGIEFDVLYEDVSKAGLSIREGLHAYTDTTLADDYDDCTMKEYVADGNNVYCAMIIPKGTQYIVSECGTEVVALAMRLAKPEKRARSKRKPAKSSKRKLAGKRKKK